MKDSSNAGRPSIIGSNQVNGYPGNDTSTADLDNTVLDVWFTNIRAESIGASLMRIVPLHTTRTSPSRTLAWTHSVTGAMESTGMSCLLGKMSKEMRFSSRASSSVKKLRGWR